MSSRIEKKSGPCVALALAAMLAPSACSDGTQLLATIQLDASAPEVTPQCVPRAYQAPDVGLDLYFVIDHTEFGQTPGGWNALFSGLANLFGRDEFKGVGTGFAIYPEFEPFQACLDLCGATPSCSCVDRCGCEDSRDDRQAGYCRCDEWQTSCDEPDYAPRFEIEPLTAEARQQQALFLLGLPRGLPALGTALLGSLRYRNAWENARPRRRVTQVLIATAPFFICSETEDIEKVLSGPDKPKTYVVTVDLSDPDYDRFAVAGRTDAAVKLRVNARPPAVPLATALIDLLHQIRSTEGRCEYLLPPPSPELEYDKVNLAARDGTPLRYVEDASGCAGTPQGWYYDDSAHPTRIMTCEGACKTLHQATTDIAAASAFIQLGCPTVRDAGN
jgi:hypothetical protein